MNATKCLPVVISALPLILAVNSVHADDPKPDPALQGTAKAIRGKIEAEYSSLEALYKHIHSHPELSYQEEKTSARLVKEMKELGFDVTNKVGGHGIVCVLKNGEGPTVLIRTDMDALPVTEQTGVPYASKARGRNQAGAEVGIMHACGHDMHMTCWIGTAKVLSSMKDQ